MSTIALATGPGISMNMYELAHVVVTMLDYRIYVWNKAEIRVENMTPSLRVDDAGKVYL